MVITQKNAVHSALALIFGLLAQAGLYLMLYAPFVAGVQIILYAGGIMVLFLFVIMLVNLERSQKEDQFNKQWLVGLLAALALGGLLVAVYLKGGATVPATHCATDREQQHPGDRSPAVRQLHVRLRDRVVVAVGGHHRRGSHGEEEDLAVGN